MSYCSAKAYAFKLDSVVISQVVQWLSGYGSRL